MEAEYVASYLVSTLHSKRAEREGLGFSGQNVSPRCRQRRCAVNLLDESEEQRSAGLVVESVGHERAPAKAATVSYVIAWNMMRDREWYGTTFRNYSIPPNISRAILKAEVFQCLTLICDA